VPDPRFPFLGVHFTRRISGKVDAGPNRCFCSRARGLSSPRHQSPRYRFVAGFPGFLAGWRGSIGEVASMIPAFAIEAALCARAAAPGSRGERGDLVPAVRACDAQALKSDGTLVDDFQFVPSGKVLHVLITCLARGHGLAHHWQPSSIWQSRAWFLRTSSRCCF